MAREEVEAGHLPPPPPGPPPMGGGKFRIDSQAMVSQQVEKVESAWLDAWQDPVANVQAYSPCVRMADLNGDGEWRLLVADSRKKLKVWKGTALQSEHNLLEAPAGICPFYSDLASPRIPALGVAAGPFVFIYRNLRPYYKFTLPLVVLDAREVQVWGELGAEAVDVRRVADALSALREQGVTLSSRSSDFLAVDDHNAAARAAFAEKVKGKPLTQQTCATCIEAIKRNMEEADAQSSLVVGTEAGELLILDPTGTSIQTTVKLPAVPVFLAINGLLDVDYRVVVAARNGYVYTVKNGELSSTVMELESQPVGLIRTNKSVIVGCMNNTLVSYHIKGKKNYSLYLPSSILTMELLSVQRQRMVKAVIVALANGEVRVYNDKHLVSVHSSHDPVMGMRFGRFGREENTMVMTHASGALGIKILPRHAPLEPVDSRGGAPPEQDVPLNVPKKTKLYVEQTQREREQAVDMHRIFQRDLCKLRLSTARAYVRVLTDNTGPISYSAGSSLRLNVQVQGLGPFFKLKLMLQNTGTKPIFNLPLLITCNPTYHVDTPQLAIPCLLPGLNYSFETTAECLDPGGNADNIRVLVAASGDASVPALSAIVKMPVSEVLEEEG